LEVCGRAGSLRSADGVGNGGGFFAWRREEVEEEAVVVLLESIMAVAKEADFFRASLAASGSVVLGLGDGCCCCSVEEGSAPVPVDADADAEADAELPHAFFAARPRTSPTSSAADFFLDLSSSEDRLEDMIVSRVP
jgi:hypothetical protein